jgi:hypothetical protein
MAQVSVRSMWTYSWHIEASRDVGNIGISIGSVSWVTDPMDHSRLVPVGCVSEFSIEGPVLARSYLERPVEMAKAFHSLRYRSGQN